MNYYNLCICFSKYQMRIPYELLASLANCLLNDTIFEIVKGLMEIQHVTEQHLYQQRLQFINNKKGKMINVMLKGTCCLACMILINIIEQIKLSTIQSIS